LHGRWIYGSAGRRSGILVSEELKLPTPKNQLPRISWELEVGSWQALEVELRAQPDDATLQDLRRTEERHAIREDLVQDRVRIQEVEHVHLQPHVPHVRKCHHLRKPEVQLIPLIQVFRPWLD